MSDDRDRNGRGHGNYGPNDGGRGSGDRMGRGGGGGGGRFGGSFGGVKGMQEIAEIQTITFIEQDVLSIINPSAEDRARDNVIGNPVFPRRKDSQWRTKLKAGPELAADNESGKGIVSNFFPIANNSLLEKIFHYDVKIYKFRFDKETNEKYVDSEDFSQKPDLKLNYSLIKLLREHNNLNWLASQGYGFVYDGHAALFTSKQLFNPGNDGGRVQENYESSEMPRPGSNSRKDVTKYGPNNGARGRRQSFDDKPLVAADLARDFAMDLAVSDKEKYHVRLRQVAVLKRPDNAERIAATGNDQSYVRALDVAVLAFARGQAHEETPDWIYQGSKVFRANGSLSINMLQPNIIALKGHSVSMKSTIRGFALVCDMAVTCFLQGGELVDFLVRQNRCRNPAELVDKFRNPNSVERDMKDALSTLKNVKLKLKHTKFSKKLFDFGPNADSPDSAFDVIVDGVSQRMTVAGYFEHMAMKDPNYALYLGSNKRLKYPSLPTVNVGNKNKPILIPVELCKVPIGEPRHHLAPSTVAQVIKEAAVKPQMRMQHIIKEGSILNDLKKDADSQIFGLCEVDTNASRVKAAILPPAKLRYKSRDGRSTQIVEPKLSGSWKSRNMQFVAPPPNPVTLTNGSKGYKFATITANNDKHGPDFSRTTVTSFGKALVSEATNLGLNGTYCGNVDWNSHDRNTNLQSIFKKFLQDEVRIVIVVMCDLGQCYSEIKNCADYLGIATQCCKSDKVSKPPGGYYENLMLKINTKMGGTNWTLASRLSQSEQERISEGEVFQSPPGSISWVFDKPTMLVGMDVSHPEPGEQGAPMASVVCSLDGSAWQYAAHMSAQDKNENVNASLSEAINGLMATFKSKNKNTLPEHVIVFRDGLSEGQFSKALETEINLIRGAVTSNGGDGNLLKITVLACSKRHQSRFAYNYGTVDRAEYTNPCPGVCIDASDEAHSVVSDALHEFYLNSHVAIQGTAKSTKYTLLYDQIGFKMAEIELLTYWTTYLYCRCSKSVSLAAPAYYARWAAQRARVISKAVSDPAQLAERLQHISRIWSSVDSNSSMFFV